MPLAAGHILSHYEILGPLGAGAMGDVYRARDTRLGREVAIKILAAGLVADESARKRLRREARSLSRIQHPNIEVVFDVGEEAGMDFLAMELIEGEQLARLIAEGPLPESRVAKLGLQIAAGLEAAHEAGVIHRDLKPANVIVTPKDGAKVLDFGLSKLLHEEGVPVSSDSLSGTNAVAGTLPYMAPEQLRGETGPRSDVFSAGAVLYELATGVRPFPDESPAELIESILHREPRPPSLLNHRVSPALEATILKALEKDPEVRYQSATDLRVDLERLLRPASRGVQPATGSTRRAAPIVGGLLVFVLAVLALDVGGIRGRVFGTGDLGDPIRSLAILPLVELGAAEPDLFVDGMTEALITEMGRIGSLRVIGSRSALRFKDSDLTVREIAGRLNVEVVIVGTVQRVDEQVAVDVRLIRAETEEQLWSQRFERELRDILSLQSEIARSAARSVRVEMTPEERRGLTRDRPVDPRAYDACLMGNFYWKRRDKGDLEQAIAYFEQAIAIEPEYAQAHAGLSGSWMLLAMHDEPPEVIAPRAKEAALEALRLDDRLAEAHTALGRIKVQFERDWEAAERSYLRALELNPNDASAHHFYGGYLAIVGRFDEAIEETRRGVELDPFSLISRGVEAWTLFLAGREEEAFEAFEVALALEPRFLPNVWLAGNCHVYAGRVDEGIRLLERAVEVSGRGAPRVAHLGRAYGKAGRADDAREILTELEALAEERYVSPANLALAHLGVGDRARALALLERGFERGDASLAFLSLKVSPAFDELRGEERFQRLIERLGLAD